MEPKPPVNHAVNHDQLADSEPIQRPELSAEISRVIINIQHITLVQSYLHHLAAELQRRALTHDLSKWLPDEFGGFVALNDADKRYGYGTPEYKAALAGVDAVGLHTSRNRHHPEFHPNGVSDMGLADLIEMVGDWIGAFMVYGAGTGRTLEDSITKSIERFGLDEKQAFVVWLIVKEITP